MPRLWRVSEIDFAIDILHMKKTGWPYDCKFCGGNGLTLCTGGCAGAISVLAEGRNPENCKAIAQVELIAETVEWLRERGHHGAADQIAPAKPHPWWRFWA